MYFKLILFSLLLLGTNFADAQVFITSNSSESIHMEVRLSRGGDQLQNVVVERATKSTISREAVLANPLINTSDLKFSADNPTITIPSDGNNYFLSPMAPRADLIQLSAGDRLTMECGCGESPDEDGSACGLTTNTAIYSSPATHCLNSGSCGEVCQSFIMVYGADGKQKNRSISGGVLFSAERAQARTLR
nr:hypothetical protein [Saprospiraceae bacterium]